MQKIFEWMISPELYIYKDGFRSLGDLKCNLNKSVKVFLAPRLRDHGFKSIVIKHRCEL